MKMHYQAWPTKSRNRWYEFLFVLLLGGVILHYYSNSVSWLTSVLAALAALSLWMRLKPPRPIFEIDDEILKVSSIEVHHDRIVRAFVSRTPETGHCVVIEADRPIMITEKPGIEGLIRTWQMKQHLYGKNSFSIDFVPASEFEAHAPKLKEWLGSKFETD